jgi:hypothetical protein
MEQIGKIIEKLKEWAQTVIDTLLGPQGEPETELIPIPIRDHPRRGY